MKKFFEDLKENATKIINREKKEMLPLTKEEKCKDEFEEYNDGKK